MSAALQMAAGLVIVLAAIAGTAWVLRRSGAVTGGSLFRIVSSIPVGTRERVVLLELGEQWLVLGVAPGRVSSLATLPRGEAPAVQAFDFKKIFEKKKGNA